MSGVIFFVYLDPIWIPNFEIDLGTLWNQIVETVGFRAGFRAGFQAGFRVGYGGGFGAGLGWFWIGFWVGFRQKYFYLVANSMSNSGI